MSNKEAIEDIYNRYKNIDKNDKFFKKKFRPTYPTLRYAAVILFIVVVSSSISIGNNFFNYRSKSNIGYIDEGIYTSIENNNMQNISMNYQKSNNVGVKVSNILIDNSKIYLVFDFEFYEPLTDDVNLLELPDMIISDDSNNVLYCRNSAKYTNFCKINNLNYADYETKEAQIINQEYFSQFISKDQNHIQYLFVLSLNENYEKPKCRLNISFENIDLYDNLLLYDENAKTTKTGNWNLELNLNKK